MSKQSNTERVTAIRDEVQGYSRIQMAQHSPRIVESLLDVLLDVCEQLESMAPVTKQEGN